MSKKNTAQPANPFHPGEILPEEFLRPRKITQAAFARKIGWTKARLNEFVRGKRGVTAERAPCGKLVKILNLFTTVLYL